MGRSKRLGGTKAPEWTARINALFHRHPLLTTQGVAHVLSDMARARGQRQVTYYALATNRNRSKCRRPPDYFQDLWKRLEVRVAELDGEGELAVFVEGGQHVVAPVGRHLVTLWIPPSAQWAVHRCPDCKVYFIGQHNSGSCPACR